MAVTDQDEIEKIMNEIEELQKDIAPTKPTFEDDILGEIQASAPKGGDSGGLEDTLADIKSETVSGGLLDGTDDDASHESTSTQEMTEESGSETAAVVSADTSALMDDEDLAATLAAIEEEVTMPREITSAKSTEQSSDGTLSINLTGNMTLKLKYEYEGQDITISFVDQSLRVQMSDGTEFKVPVVRNTAATKNHVKLLKKAV